MSCVLVWPLLLLAGDSSLRRAPLPSWCPISQREAVARALQSWTKPPSVPLHLSSLQDLCHLADELVASSSPGHQQRPCELFILEVKFLIHAGPAGQTKLLWSIGSIVCAWILTKRISDRVWAFCPTGPYFDGK